MNTPTPSPGTPIHELNTPVLLVDLDIFEANVATMLAYCRSHGTFWRPHSKSHKCPGIARLQLQAGACGITCAKLSEAELMVANGIGPILIANQVVTPPKLARLARLQSQQEVMVAMDNTETAAIAGQAATDHGVKIPVVVEVDIGMNRVGVAPGQPALAVARCVAETPGLALRGVMGYEGHVLAVEPQAEKIRVCHQALDLLLEVKALLEQDGMPVPVVSAGGTGCYEITAAYPGITEVQAGGGIFMDAMYRHKFHVDSLNYALTCLATVTSRSTSHVVVDAGFKTMSSFHQAPFPLERDDLELRNLSAEHGIFDLKSGAAGPRVGEQIRFVVGYSDSTTVLHDRLLGIRADRVERIWQIEGRGLLD